MAVRPSYSPLTEADFDSAHPSSEKTYVSGGAGVEVPVRRVTLTNGESIDLYDTSGPRGWDVHVGLPALRRDWIVSRGDVTETRKGTRRTILKGKEGVSPTQLGYARKGVITPEMEYIAVREGLPADFVRSEVARGRAISPAN